jgi:hypothetical protein
MSTDLATLERPTARQQIRSGPLDLVESVDGAREIIGAAIVRTVFREIGLNKARAILRAKPSLKLSGNFFQQVAHQHQFTEAGDRKIRLLAETLGIDPNFEIAVAYAIPESYYATCKWASIEVPGFLRRRLESRRAQFSGGGS